MHTTLVLMAAGLGSRYGGNKQVDGIGPNGEILMNYGIYDAVKAGFDKVVFIIKPGLEDIVERLCGRQLRDKKVKVDYVYQTFENCVPDWYAVPEDRVKPLGTTHAVLCAKEAVQEPFAVINADDYYGSGAFTGLHDALLTMEPAHMGAMVGYRLKNTLSATGTVTRGVCHMRDGYLTRVVETYKIMPFPDGTIRDVNFRPEGDELDPDCLVSMNMWGFTPWIFEKLEAHFDAFLKGLAPEEIKKESVLPTVVDALIQSGEMRVKVLSTDSRWFGVTNREDRPIAAAALKKLHDEGLYPETLLD